MMKEEEDYLYGNREERDPRKRKRLSDEGGQEEGRRSRSRERRRRSRSKESDDYRRGPSREEERKPGSVQEPRMQSKSEINQNNGSRNGEQYPQKTGDDDGSDGEESKKTKQGPLSPEQREKLVKQKEQYEKAAEKLEDQLLKLKEQREALKLQGQKHEDTIMKENAKLQKEVKYRITYMKDYMVKIEAGLAEDAKVQEEARERRRVEEEREIALREQENRRIEQERRNLAELKAASEDREKKKKKKKAKSRDRSSSSSDSENDRKKKKKSKKHRSTDSDSSEEDRKKKRKKDVTGSQGLEEDMFRMVAMMKSRKKKSGGGGADDVLVDLMGRMSEGYSRVKAENTELNGRYLVLEGQNKKLQNRVEELEEQLRRGGDEKRTEKKERKSRFKEERDEEKNHRSRHRSDSADDHSQEIERYRQNKRPVSPPAVPVRPLSPPRSPPKAKPPPPGVPVGANANLEALGSRPPRTKGAGGLSAVLALAGGYVEPPPNMVAPPPQPVAPPAMVPMPVMHPVKEEHREDEKRGSRRRRDSSRSKSRSRSRSRERRGSRRERSRDSRDKNDKIDLDQWVQPPSSQKEAGLTYLKEKIKEKQESQYKKEEEEQKNRWQKADSEEPILPPEPPKPTHEPLAEKRDSVAISWGQSLSLGRASAEREGRLGGIKVAPIVGKMPWVKGTVGTNGPRKSKFGPPVDAAIPPPSMITSQPTLAPPPVLQEPPVLPPPVLAPPPLQDWTPPPGIRTDWAATAPPTQPPAWEQPPPALDTATYGYGSQELPPPPPEVHRRPSRNPKQTVPLDMNAMLAAAQQHMQKSLANKLQSIGVPVPEHYRQQVGLTNRVDTYDLPEAIPLPGDPVGVDMGIADIAIPDDAPDIPLPPGMDDNIAVSDDDIAASDDDIAEPEPRILPAGNGPFPRDYPASPGDDDDCRPPGED